MKRDNTKKFCPKCGVQNGISDAYCINCGFSFIKRKKNKTNPILLLLLLLIMGWIFYRTFTKQPLIPTELSSLFKSLNLSKVK
jgi:ribosomal protein L40E